MLEKEEGRRKKEGLVNENKLNVYFSKRIVLFIRVYILGLLEVVEVSIVS